MKSEQERKVSRKEEIKGGKETRERKGKEGLREEAESGGMIFII